MFSSFTSALQIKGPKIKGIMFTIAAVLLGGVIGGLVKYIADDLTLLTVLFFRFLFSLPLLFIAALWVRGPKFLHITQKRTMCARVIFGIAGISFWFLSIRHLPLGQATALFQSYVLFVTILSPLLLNERVGIYRSTAVLLGLCGIIFLTDPFSQTISWAVLYGMGASFTGAALALTLRKLGKGDAPVTIAIIYNISGFTLLFVVVLIAPAQFSMPRGDMWLVLIGLGVSASLLQLCLTSAYRYSDAVIVSSLRYLQLPVALIFGFIFFTEMPSLVQFFGMLIVVFSCVFIIWREFVITKPNVPPPHQDHPL